MKKIKITIIISALILELLSLIILQMCVASNASPVLGIIILVIGLVLLIIGITLRPGPKQD